jgi:hypothetical protein
MYLYRVQYTDTMPQQYPSNTGAGLKMAMDYRKSD